MATYLLLSMALEVISDQAKKVTDGIQAQHLFEY